MPQREASENPGAGPTVLEAERAVLGSILIDPTLLEVVAPLVTPTDFYRESHELIYRAILDLSRKGEPIDTLTLALELDHNGLLERVGGRTDLLLFQEAVPSAANAIFYAEEVVDASLIRRLMKLGSGVQGLVTENGRTAKEMLAEVTAMVSRVAEGNSPNEDGEVGALLTGIFGKLDARVEGKVTGVPTGLVDLDALTGGLQRGDLVVLGGRPSHGKSALLAQVALTVAKTGEPALIFSLEMSRESLAERMLANLANVEQSKIARGTVSDDEVGRLYVASGPLGDLPIRIDDSPSHDEVSMRLAARRYRSKKGGRLGIVFVDYLQLMHGHDRRRGGGNREEEVAGISRGLKALARELDVPVVAISSLSRECEKRENKRPVLADLRESGQIEADADLVFFCYRDSLYRDSAKAKKATELIVRKHRNGPVGTVDVGFRPETGTFFDLARQAGIEDGA